MADIIVVGGLNMDLHVFGVQDSGGQAALLADSYLAQPGGKGANVARSVARLGCSVRLVGVVGDDEFGRDCVRSLAAEGVDTGGIRVDPETPTGFVVIELVQGKHRSLLYAPGANNRLDWKDVEPHLAGLGRDGVVIAQAEIPTEVLDRVASAVSEVGATLYLDPTPPDKVKASHLALATAITPDLAEASRLVGRSDTSSLWPVLAAHELRRCGAARVIIKLGAAGALLADGDRVDQIPTLEVTAVDETGAGDVFLAALAVGRNEGAPWHHAVRFANAASALSVAGSGLTLPSRASVDAAVVSLT